MGNQNKKNKQTIFFIKFKSLNSNYDFMDFYEENKSLKDFYDWVKIQRNKINENVVIDDFKIIKFKQ